MSNKFKYNYVDGDLDGDLLACDSCSWVAPLAKYEAMSAMRRGEIKYICEVCASTEIGSATDYALQGNLVLYRALAQCTNMVLDQITGRKPK